MSESRNIRWQRITLMVQAELATVAGLQDDDLDITAEQIAFDTVYAALLAARLQKADTRHVARLLRQAAEDPSMLDSDAALLGDAMSTALDMVEAVLAEAERQTTNPTSH